MRGAAYRRRARHLAVVLALPLAITVSPPPALADPSPPVSDIAPAGLPATEQNGAFVANELERSQSLAVAAEAEVDQLTVLRADNKRPESHLKIIDRSGGTTSFTFTVSEPADVYYTLDGSRPTPSSLKLSAGTGGDTQQITVDKTTTVSWFSVDLAGNVEKNYKPSGNGNNYNKETVTVHALPVTTATTDPAEPAGGWFTGPVSVTLSATAGPDVKIDRTEYQLDGGAWTTYTALIAIIGDGSHTLAYRSIDTKGAVEPTKTLTVKVDTTAPVTTATTGPATAGSAPVTLSATDDASGVAKTEYSLDGGDWIPYTQAVAVSGQGEHELRFRSTDRAGNTEEIKVATVPVAPELTLTVTAQARCVGTSAHVAVTAVNNADVPANVTLTTPYGSTTVPSVLPGNNAYQSFNTRSAQIAAGTTTVTATATIGGRQVTSTYNATYTAINCN